MKKFYGLFALPTMILLTACEGNTTVEIRMRNESSSPAECRFVQIMLNDTVHVTLEPGKSEVVLLDDQRGGRKSAQPIHSWIRDVVITNSEGDALLRNPNEQDQWSVNIERRRRIPADYKHTYLFEFGEEDFEP